MCVLTSEAVKEMPELALYGLVFDEERDAPFTLDSLASELAKLGVDQLPMGLMGRCLKKWIDDGKVRRHGEYLRTVMSK